MYTGNTRVGYYQYRYEPVYPCVYREHNNCVKNRFRVFGLSLCIQGTPLHLHFFQQYKRFIPVYTGNTITTVQLTLLGSVYPCVYREHDNNRPVDVVRVGLSLCIQGTLKNFWGSAMRIRFIPVYTGNTSFDCLNESFSAVYPCVYREHALFGIFLNCFNGLSLCIQGTL